MIGVGARLRVGYVPEKENEARLNGGEQESQHQDVT